MSKQFVSNRIKCRVYIYIYIYNSETQRYRFRVIVILSFDIFKYRLNKVADFKGLLLHVVEYFLMTITLVLLTLRKVDQNMSYRGSYTAT
jgi:hypothetical protein